LSLSFPYLLTFEELFIPTPHENPAFFRLPSFSPRSFTVSPLQPQLFYSEAGEVYPQLIAFSGFFVADDVLFFSSLLLEMWTLLVQIFLRRESLSP